MAAAAAAAATTLSQETVCVCACAELARGLKTTMWYSILFFLAMQKKEKQQNRMYDLTSMSFEEDSEYDGKLNFSLHFILILF